MSDSTGTWHDGAQAHNGCDVRDQSMGWEGVRGLTFLPAGLDGPPVGLEEGHEVGPCLLQPERAIHPAVRPGVALLVPAGDAGDVRHQGDQRVFAGGLVGVQSGGRIGAQLNALQGRRWPASLHIRGCILCLNPVVYQQRLQATR
jgi:hypothetical protein